MKRKLISLVLVGSLLAGGIASIIPSNSNIKHENNILLAQPAVGKVIVTLGANNTYAQRQQLLQDFNVSTSDKNITFIQTTNRDIAQELGYTGNINDIPNTGSYSSAKITILPAGSGIQVTTNNLTEVTGDMLASALTTCGINNASIDADAPMPVTGQAALAGVLQAFQQATGETVPEQNKKVANNEINTTANIAKTVGQQKAETIVNQAKSIVIKDNPNSKIEVQNIVNNVVNNNGGGLSQQQEAQLTNLMEQIKGLNLNYNKVEGTLKNIQDSIAKGEKNFTNVSAKLQQEIKDNHVAIQNTENFFEKIWNWIKTFFEGGEKAVSSTNNTQTNTTAQTNASQANNVAQTNSTQGTGTQQQVNGVQTNTSQTNNGQATNTQQTNTQSTSTQQNNA